MRRTGVLRFLSTLLLLVWAASAAAQQIPPGTVLPIALSSTLDVRHAKPGQAIAGKIMQEVPLPDGSALPCGAKVLGHIVSARRASPAAPSQLTIRFDQLEFKGRRTAIATHLRALASMNEVFEARMPTNAWDDYGTSPSDWNTVQVGGAGVYRGSGQVVDGDRIVGRATDYGAVLAKLTAAPERGCPGSSQREQALWKFSPWACGTYGFSDLRIVHPEGAGAIAFESSGNVHIDGGSGWLLRVDSVDSASPTR